MILITGPVLPFYKTNGGRVTIEILRYIKTYFPKIQENSDLHAAAWP